MTDTDTSRSGRRHGQPLRRTEANRSSRPGWRNHHRLFDLRCPAAPVSAKLCSSSAKISSSRSGRQSARDLKSASQSSMSFRRLGSLLAGHSGAGRPHQTVGHDARDSHGRRTPFTSPLRSSMPTIFTARKAIGCWRTICSRVRRTTRWWALFCATRFQNSARWRGVFARWMRMDF